MLILNILFLYLRKLITNIFLKVTFLVKISFYAHNLQYLRTQLVEFYWKSGSGPAT